MKPITGSSLFTTVNQLNFLIDNLLLLLTDKEKSVIIGRFNLDGRGRHTLDNIGKKYGVTRERVRQIEKNALNKMSRNVDNVGFGAIHDFMNNMVEENGGYVTEDFLYDELVASVPVETKFNQSHLHLAFVLNESVKCIGNTVNYFPYIRRNNISDSLLKDVSSRLIKELNVLKSTTEIKDIKKAIAEDGDSKISDKKIKSLVLIDKRISLVDNVSIALMSWRHVRPRTLRDKILYILNQDKKPVHFREIASKISSLNFDDRAINIQAVHNELIRHDSFVLIGRGIYALKEWGYERGTVSDVILDILSNVSEMEKEKIVDQVLAVRQVKRITILLALKNGKRFERVGRRFYRLVK